MGIGANEKGGHNLSANTTTTTSSPHSPAYSSNDPGGRGSAVVHCSGTVDSFNNHGNGPQIFTNAEINSGKNSGGSNDNHHQASNSGGESTRLPNHCSGTQSSFNCDGNGSQNLAGKRINSGENSGNRGGPSSGASEQQPRVTGTRDLYNDYGSTQLSNRSGSGTEVGHRFLTILFEKLTGGRGSAVVHCSGTLGSFNCDGNGSQIYTNAEINSGKNSGGSHQNHHQASNSGRETTRLLNHCSGTQFSFNCYREGSQNFASARINSGENSGNRDGSSSGASEQQPRGTGTRDLYNYGSTQISNRSGSGTVVGYCSGTLRSFQNFPSNNSPGAKINSNENSGGS